jgi:hypothetical protein
MCVEGPLPSQIMCAGKGAILRVGPFIIARRYTYCLLLREWRTDPEGRGLIADCDRYETKDGER